MERDPMEIVVTVDILALDKMMTFLNVKDLLSCRLVSNLWNRAASLELRERSTMIKMISTEDKLMELEDCMKQSWNFPFAGLKFNRPWELKSDSAKEFFKEYGTEFTSLCLDTKWTGRLDDLAPFIYHLPRLSILELGHFHSHRRTRSSVPPVDSAAGQEDEVPTFRFLRTLRISTSKPGQFEEVLGQVVQAASPSLQIECLGIPSGILRVLKSTGKLRALSVMKFGSHCSRELRSGADRLLATGSPSLTKLDFHALGCLSMYGLKKVLFSSQGTLRELRVLSIELSELSVYKHLAFTKLTTLTFDFDVGRKLSFDSVGICLFRGRNEGNFPVLKHIRLKIRYAAMHLLGDVFVDDLVLKNVKTFDLDGYVNEDGMKRLGQVFPNVTEMRLDSGFYSGQYMPLVLCGRDPSEIWNVQAFSRLEKLVIWNFTVGGPAEPYINMDSFLTGIPFEECQELNLNNIPFSETLRVTASILKLESLKQLVVCVKLGKGLIRPIERAPFISMVSVRYALEMMPKLQAKFVYEPLLHTKGDTEVLETAFKPVQKHVPLERFHY